ncbi:cytochrome b5 reductase 4-like [Montipora foliosa]|uniref:cytochrome b5 reductase 4-like n=1 Tax=Montipora foliosa TaxID=591990 RepID=UPI0035F21892
MCIVDAADFFVDGTKLANVTRFRYLKAVSCVGYGKRVFDSHDLTVPTKVAVYNQYLVPLVVYGSETWTVCQHQVRELRTLQQRHLRIILNIKWDDFVRNEEVLRRANVEDIEISSFYNYCRYDWYQNDKIVTISVYTKKKDLRLEDIILELIDGKDFNAIFILGIKSFQIHIVLSNVVTCQQVRISGATGKADVLLTKETSGVKWTDLGQGLLGNNSLKLHKDRESRLWDCRVVSVEAVTHNCKLFCCELPDGIVMRVPIGHHIHLHRDVEGMKISRPYTVVLPSLRFSLDEREHDGRRFYLMIKIYPDGTLTPTLSAIDVGDILQISDYSGDFKESRLIEARDIILIAGERGLTQMIRLVRRAVLESSSTETSVKLLFANNQEKDILWKQQLNEMVETASQRFQVYYTVSQPTPEWDGYEGRVSLEMLLEILPPPPSAGHERKLLICICGPDPFTHHIVSTLKDLSYAENMIHAFLG